jgi:hypothetical protein
MKSAKEKSPFWWGVKQGQYCYNMGLKKIKCCKKAEKCCVVKSRLDRKVIIGFTS